MYPRNPVVLTPGGAGGKAPARSVAAAPAPGSPRGVASDGLRVGQRISVSSRDASDIGFGGYVPAPARSPTPPLSVLVSPISKSSSAADIADVALACVDSYIASVAAALGELRASDVSGLDKGPAGGGGGWGGASPGDPSSKPFVSPARAGAAQDPSYITPSTPGGARASASSARSGKGGAAGGSVSSSESDPLSPSHSAASHGSSLSSARSAESWSASSSSVHAPSPLASAEALLHAAAAAGVPIAIAAFDIDDTLVRAADGRAIGPIIELCTALVARRISCHLITGRLDDAGGMMHSSTVAQLAALGLRAGTSYDSLILAPAAARVTMSALSQWKREQRALMVSAVRATAAERLRQLAARTAGALSPAGAAKLGGVAAPPPLFPAPILLLSVGDQWGDMLPLGTDFDIGALDAALGAAAEIAPGHASRGVATHVGSSTPPRAAGSPVVTRSLFGSVGISASCARGGPGAALSASMALGAPRRFAVIPMRDSRAAVRVAVAGAISSTGASLSNHSSTSSNGNINGNSATPLSKRSPIPSPSTAARLSAALSSMRLVNTMSPYTLLPAPGACVSAYLASEERLTPPTSPVPPSPGGSWFQDAAGDFDADLGRPLWGVKLPVAIQ